MDKRAPSILIVGGGLAGVFCALKLAPSPVTILAPAGIGGASAWAQGGVAAAVSEGDTPEVHAADTIAAGAGLVDADIALGVALEARARIDDLAAFGAPFDRDALGVLQPSREAAHTHRRIVRVKGDAAGRAIMETLARRVRETPSIEVVGNRHARSVAPLGVSLRQRFPVLPRPNLDWTPQVEAATAHLYEHISKVMPPVEWPFHAPYVKAINELKRERNAVILAHNYQTPEIYHCVADYVGDSLQLAKLAAASPADVIVQGGVHFMAETSKNLSPEKTVLIPDSEAGCSLAASITGADVRALRLEYPGVPISPTSTPPPR